MAATGKYGKIEFSDDDIQFIKDNFQAMTNDQLAGVMGLKKTVLRMKAYELGLQRMQLEYWPKEAVQFLRDNYHKMGNCEMCRIFNEQFPKQKGWKKAHIDKKMEYMNLKRTKLDLYMVKERNRDNGSYGRRNLKNSPAPPKSYFYLNPKTRIEIKPGQSVEGLREKYAGRLGF